MSPRRDPNEARTEYGRAIQQQAAALRLSRRYAQSGGEDAADYQQDVDDVDLGSERAAQAMRVENYHRRR